MIGLLKLVLIVYCYANIINFMEPSSEKQIVDPAFVQPENQPMTESSASGTLSPEPKLVPQPIKHNKGVPPLILNRRYMKLQEVIFFEVTGVDDRKRG